MSRNSWTTARSKSSTLVRKCRKISDSVTPARSAIARNDVALYPWEAKSSCAAVTINRCTSSDDRRSLRPPFTAPAMVTDSRLRGIEDSTRSGSGSQLGYDSTQPAQRERSGPAPEAGLPGRHEVFLEEGA